ncbi:class I SAM-dependent methyltransferase [Paenibacillus sp. XY044]|uniref:class I SAM-dependent methyltransferase n=1 Tax=Paenibacillus sp. XY044 TaxID=2026089 RepID=UPI0015C63E66|nr:class I SAM-dependent methyltransferase [Paenibacillus sp. XY044]
MVPEGNNQRNIDRFSGYGDTYDRYRPAAPPLVTSLLSGYLQHRPELVLDLGCGTGLSTLIWKEHADQVIGIEPNDDMRSVAEFKLERLNDSAHVRFISGYSNQLAVGSETADMITCSQSFHWMEPSSTLLEAARVLKPGGIFAAYDCDWPPTLHWQVEQAYEEVINRADDIIRKLLSQEKRAVKRDKEKHLASIQDSGHFRFTKEIVFHHAENCDAERYFGIAMSQGGVQTVLRLNSNELDEDIERFKRIVDDFFQGKTLQVLFSYRMRLGVK